MDAESVHDRTLALLALAQAGWARPFLHQIAGQLPKKPIEFAGRTLPNVLGMAAGFDKDVLVCLVWLRLALATSRWAR